MKPSLITTRCMHSSLYDKMLLFTEDFECEKIPYKMQRCSLQYFINIISDAIDKGITWLINIDEDAFIVDSGAVKKLIAYMDENKIGYCGMPDGGHGGTRADHPLVMNACFNIFNIDMIKPIFDVEEIRKTGLDKHVKIEHQQYIESLPGEFKFRFAERYYRFFWHLLNQGLSKLFLDHRLYEDNVTTVIAHNDVDIVYHTWFSRFYPKNIQQNAEFTKDRVPAEYREHRIDKVINKLLAQVSTGENSDTL
jgi:hypothetical protein